MLGFTPLASAPLADEGFTLSTTTTALISTPGLTINTNNVTVDVSIVVFNPEQYSRKRVLYITKQDTNNTVHIQPQSRTVYIAPQDNRITVYIAA